VPVVRSHCVRIRSLRFAFDARARARARVPVSCQASIRSSYARKVFQALIASRRSIPRKAFRDRIRFSCYTRNSGGKEAFRRRAATFTPSECNNKARGKLKNDATRRIIRNKRQLIVRSTVGRSRIAPSRRAKCHVTTIDAVRAAHFITLARKSATCARMFLPRCAIISSRSAGSLIRFWWRAREHVITGSGHRIII